MTNYNRFHVNALTKVLKISILREIDVKTIIIGRVFIKIKFCVFGGEGTMSIC